MKLTKLQWLLFGFKFYIYTRIHVHVLTYYYYLHKKLLNFQHAHFARGTLRLSVNFFTECPLVKEPWYEKEWLGVKLSRLVGFNKYSVYL